MNSRQTLERNPKLKRSASTVNCKKDAVSVGWKNYPFERLKKGTESTPTFSRLSQARRLTCAAEELDRVTDEENLDSVCAGLCECGKVASAFEDRLSVAESQEISEWRCC